MNKRMHGFTVVEILFIVLVLGVACILFFVQKDNVTMVARDEQRKTAINAMYYSLEEVFYTTNNYYPASIDEIVLPSVDPDLFTDPSGVKLGENESSYRYEPVNCVDGKCKAYSLRTTLENEADFIKTNKSN